MYRAMSRPDMGAYFESSLKRRKNGASPVPLRKLGALSQVPAPEAYHGSAGIETRLHTGLGLLTRHRDAERGPDGQGGGTACAHACVPPALDRSTPSSLRLEASFS